MYAVALDSYTKYDYAENEGAMIGQSVLEWISGISSYEFA
jgi:hypothetical protein